MKSTFSLIILIVLTAASARAYKMVVVLHMPPPIQANVEQRWTADVTNTGKVALHLKLVGKATESNPRTPSKFPPGSSVIVEGTSATFDLKAGAPAEQFITVRPTRLPIGDYAVTINAVDATTNEILGTNVVVVKKKVTNDRQK